MPTIWSYGHRNPQGLAQHPVTGELYDAEHGPRGGDELNRVLPGRNYGWPVITYGMNYDGSPITDLTAKEGMEQPVVVLGPVDRRLRDRLLRGRPLPALDETTSSCPRSPRRSCAASSSTAAR